MSSPPKRPPVVFNPDADASQPAPPLPDGRPRAPLAPNEAPAAPLPDAPQMTERQRAAQSKTPKVKPYHGSCPACGHGTMFPLARFFETDVKENPTADAIMPNKVGAKFFPGLSFAIMMVSWLGGMSWDKGRVMRGRAKVKKARAEILPRCPQAVICPNCQEVLERF